ncbi:MAG: hypothetical protein JWO36_2851 [Myxococcales bacterium]|nr:hypothetical protein [Myxococcales bacterium]
MSTLDDVAAIRGAGSSSIEYYAGACERYADRICFVTRDGTITYGALWKRVRALAAAVLDNKLAVKGQLIGICGAPSPDWVVADLMCLYVGAVSVPLHVGMSFEQLRHAIRHAELETIFCGPSEVVLIQALLAECPSVRSIIVMDDASVADLPRAFTLADLERGARDVAPSVPKPGDDPLVTVNFSSGTTGMPKGVLLTERRWSAQLRFALSWPRIPHVHIGYLPHSHISGRRLVCEVMMNGGVTHFPASGDMSSLFDDIRRARPTITPLLPHLANLTFQHFQTEYLRRGGLQLAAAIDDPIGELVMQEMRGSFLGDRLCLIRTGTAPLPREMIDFMTECFDVPVANGYGSTELGSIALNGRVLPQNEYKLVDAAELGYRVSDTPPRGELYVRSPEATIGYLNDPDATAALFDPDGYVRTNDVVEAPRPGFIAPLGRRRDVLRLSHGEFVNVSELENLYGGQIPLIQQIFIYGDPHRSTLLAVVVPRLDAVAPQIDFVLSVRRQLRLALDQVARDKKLPPHEVPREFIIELEPFSRENHLLTDAFKLDRLRVTALYRERLDQLYATMDARALAHPNAADGRTLEQSIRAALGATLGVHADELEAAWSEIGFTGLGGDSLTAVRFCQLVKEVSGVAPQVAVVLDPTTTLSAIVAHVTELLEDGPNATAFEAVHGDAVDLVHARDLDIDRIRGGISARNQHPAVTTPPRVVVLTGATGFLGRFLLPELLDRLPQDGRVICLVRGGSDRAARDRLRANYRPQSALANRIERQIRAGRIVVHASDLMRRNLGLDPATHARLAREADAVVHNGALVNHALSYRSLFGPNVEGTFEIIRFALEREAMPIHFVSSIGIIEGAGVIAREEQAAEELWPTRAIGSGPDDYAIGYITSKWASEVLLAQSHQRRGVPVNIFRCGVLLPHRHLPDQVNESDAFHRLLSAIIATRLAPISFYAEGSGVAPYFGGIPVDLAASAIAAIALRGSAGLARYHVDEPVRSTVSIDTFLGAIEAAGVALERLPYAEWYRRFSEALASLPEPARSRSPIQVIGRWAKPIDPAARRRFDSTRFREQLGASASEIAPLSTAFIDQWLGQIIHTIATAPSDRVGDLRRTP